MLLSQQLLQQKYNLKIVHHLPNVSQKIDGTTIDDTEDLDLVMPMYNLIEYSSNYSETIGGLWIYSKGEATSFNNNIENIDNFKSFEYQAELLGNTAAQFTPNKG